MNAATVLDALGDPTRRRVLELLRDDGEQAVGELAAQLPVSRPAVSQHLRVLEGAGLVRERRDGTPPPLRRRRRRARRAARLPRDVLGRGARRVRPGSRRGRRPIQPRGVAMSLDPIRKHVHVRLEPDEAFRLFTAGMGTWWPLDTHSRAEDDQVVKDVVVEEHVGGTHLRAHDRRQRGLLGHRDGMGAAVAPRGRLAPERSDRATPYRGRGALLPRRRWRHVGGPGAPSLGAARRAGRGRTCAVRLGRWAGSSSSSVPSWRRRVGELSR